MAQPPAPSLGALLALTLALAACGPGGPRGSGEPIERGTALPPPGLEATPATARR